MIRLALDCMCERKTERKERKTERQREGGRESKIYPYINAERRRNTEIEGVGGQIESEEKGDGNNRTVSCLA